MPPMSTGFSVDHDVGEGILVTLFSAPDYPQFQPPHLPRFGNKASIVTLTEATDWCHPLVTQFEAVERPPGARAFYDYERAVPSEDEHFGVGEREDNDDDDEW
eukprot:TRINITY_DN1005_c3_g1_i1.p1 TRINITY_DN1005_c3_g1~~TRINITY_DN1005_c3_g1_i1.p1  ORF type:complete len:103 (-),score=13.35 TRINITY_DN1005_c3_g1_i1:36-344(-)